MATLDVSTDYQQWDNVEAVTLNLQSDGAFGADISLSYALRMDVNLQRQFFNGVAIQPHQLFWWLPVGEVGASNSVDRNAKITDSGGTVYYVVSAVKIGFGNSYSHWECLCTKES